MLTRSSLAGSIRAARADDPLTRGRGAWWPGAGRGEVLVAALLWLVGATALQLFRQPGEPSWSSIWQEDGGVFLTDALADPLGSILEPYNAYLHVVPRILSALIAPFPLEWAPALLSGSAALVVAAVAVYVFWASASVLQGVWSRALLASLVVVIPATGYETNANIANLHWYLIFAAFWVLVARPTGRGATIVGAVVVTGAVLSDPLAALLAPIALWQVLTARDRSGWIIPALFAATLAVQLLLGVVEDPVAPNAPSHVEDLPGIYALRVAGSLLVGDLFLDDFWKPYGYAFAYAALAVVAAICVAGLVRLRGTARLLLAVSVGLSTLYLAVPLMLRGTERFLDRAEFNLNGSRYVLLPILFMALALIVVVDRFGPRLSAGARRNLQFGISLYVAVLVLTNFSIFAVRTAGPNWEKGLAAARETCRSDQGTVPGEPRPLLGSIPGRTREPGQARVPVAPNIPNPPFFVVIDCDDLS